MADLAKLVVRLEAQSAQLLTELEKANNRIDRFASKTHKTLTRWAGGVAAAFSARALVQYSGRILEAQGNLVGMAQQAGESVEQVSRLGYAASQSGSDVQTLAAGLKGLQNTAADASKGSKAARDALATLGITATDTDGRLKGTSDLLLEVAEQFAQYEDGAAKSALAQDIFGKSGRDLIPLLNKGADGIRELTDRADELGITVGADAAEAANELNDKISTLTQTIGGAWGAALQEILPVLDNWVGSMTDAEGGSDTLNNAVRILATGLKLLLTAGTIVGEVFDRLGSAVGNTAAAIAAALQGDFRRAIAIQRDYWTESEDSVKQTLAEIEAIWSAAGTNIAAKAEEADAKVRKTLVFGGTGGDALQEVKIGVGKIDLDPMEKFYQELDELTRTQQERALSSYYQQRESALALFKDGRIRAEAYNARLVEINKSLDDATGVTERQTEALARQKQIIDEGRAVYEATRTPLEKYNAELVRLSNLLMQNAIDQETYNRAVANAEDAYDKATNAASQFFERATENAQDILGDGIYQAVKGGFDDAGKGVLESFGDMLLQLAAQATAAQLGKALFGDGVGGGASGGGTGGWVGAIMSIFAGSRDSGGRGLPGHAYAIGTGAQPEMFVPDQAGTFVPRDEWMGGGSVQQSNTFIIQTPNGRVPLETQQQIAARAAQSLATAQRRNT